MRRSEGAFREYSLTGNLYSIILQVGTPLAVFALFNSLFSILDTMMASHLGTIDVSTVAYMNQLRLIPNAIGSGLITGSMILINRSYGAGDMIRASLLMNTLVRLVLILSAILLMAIPFVPFILSVIGTPKEFIEEGTSYFRILLAATMLNYFNLMYINVEKARGRTGVIMVVNIATMILKLLLTALFIFVLGKGIFHIALATLITYSAFALYAAPHLFDRNSIFAIKPELVLHGKKGLSKRIMGLSYPVALEDSAFALGKVVVNSIAASYGASMIGALGISNNITGMVGSFENGFSDASSAIVSQNYGAGKHRRAFAAYKANVVITLTVSMIGLTILALFSRSIITIFATSRTGLDENFMDMIMRIFIYDAFCCIGIAVNGAGMDYLLGLGKTRITLFLNILKIFVLRIPVLFILQHFISDGATALGIMMMISNCGTAIPTTLISIHIAHTLQKEETN